MIVDPPESTKSLHQGLDAETIWPSNHIHPQGSQSNQSALGLSDNLPPPPPYSHDSDESTGSFGDRKEKVLSPPDGSSPRPRSLNSGPSYHSHQKNYPTFEPMFLIASGQYLTRGFPNTTPPTKTEPHPFVSHDVPEADWLRFLGEVKHAGRLSENQERYSQLPIVSIIPIVGSLSTHVIRQQMKKGRSKEVAKVIDNWNHHFFNPRQMEIVLMQGATRLSGLNKPLDSNASIPSPRLPSSCPESSSNGKGKGKAKDEDDNTYRLFVMPLST